MSEPGNRRKSVNKDQVGILESDRYFELEEIRVIIFISNNILSLIMTDSFWLDILTAYYSVDSI